MGTRPKNSRRNLVTEKGEGGSNTFGKGHDKVGHSFNRETQGLGRESTRLVQSQRKKKGQRRWQRQKPLFEEKGKEAKKIHTEFQGEVITQNPQGVK